MKRIKAIVEPTPGLSSYLDEATSPGYGEFRDYREGAAYRNSSPNWSIFSKDCADIARSVFTCINRIIKSSM